MLHLSLKKIKIKSISEIPVQIITTSCDAINGKYNIFSLTVSFPIT
jgi:hypothetical protein